MTTIDIIKQRYSCRKFKADALSDDVIQNLSDCALAAPTAMDRQSLRFHFIEDQEMIEAISEKVLNEAGEDVRERMKSRGASSIFYGAPLVIAITSVEEPYAEMNAGIAVQTLALAAEAQDLASCIIGMSKYAFNDHKMAEKLGFEDDEKFIITIAIGHPDMEKAPHESDASHIIHHK